MKAKVLIIGGGLAGLTAGLGLLKEGISVCLIEKDAYPRHKVCGEYVSNEVLPYLHFLGIDPHAAGAVDISRLQCSSLYGPALELKLPLGGFGLSRYALDHLLYKQFIEKGGEVIEDQVMHVNRKDKSYEIKTISGALYETSLVLGTFGKRSKVDIQLSRKFVKEKTPWLGIKMHYKAAWDPELVSLHNFEGGYCGISQVEDQRVNVCYLAHIDTFKDYKDIDLFQQQILRKNRYLDSFFKEAEPLFDDPLSISQISFHRKERVFEHILMCGDSASLIHPLCGNGMAMAIMGAEIATTTITCHIKNGTSRDQLEKNYAQEWDRTFNTRLKWGRRLQNLFTSTMASKYGIGMMRYTPWMLKQFIQKTHGKPAVL